MKSKGFKRFLPLALPGLTALLLAAASPAPAIYLPQLVRDINPGSANSFPEQLTVVGDTLFFVADDGISGRELWKHSPGGTSLVKDITPGEGSSQLEGLKNVNGTLYFVLSKEVAFDSYEYELWKSDGTETGTVKVAGPFGFFGTLGNIMTIGPLFQGVGSTVYFFAGDFGGDFGLWKTPGDTGEIITPYGFFNWE
jgi:ELWxxDGT repeat protein